MRIPIPTVSINGVDCVEGDLSLAISTGVAARIIPITPDGAQFVDHEIPVVGQLEDPRFAVLLTAIREAAASMLGA